MSIMDTITDMSKELIANEVNSVTVVTKQVRDVHIGYSDNVRLVYVELLSLGVYVDKCSDEVKTVLTGLTD